MAGIFVNQVFFREWFAFIEVIRSSKVGGKNSTLTPWCFGGQLIILWETDVKLCMPISAF